MFSDWVNKKVKEAEDSVTNNPKFVHPFTKVGDIHSGADYTAVCLAEDQYRVYVGPYSHLAAMRATPSYTTHGAFGVATIKSTFDAHEYVVDSHTITQVISGASLPQIGLPRMTKQQENRLDELQKEFDLWKKRQKLMAYKRLPPHIRQDIVDEALYKKMIIETNKIEQTDFPDFKELKDLKSLRESGQHLYSGIASTPFSSSIFGHTQSLDVGKYAVILSEFSLEELMQAHTEASLDDELSD
jgi:hypothetical protein